VLSAIEQVPRERFVSPAQRDVAFEDRALAIAAGQTISQPYVVARMTELLELTGRPGETVLEVGTGSGYQTAVLARLTSRIISIERLESLSLEARRTLGALGVENVEFHVGDGSLGCPEGGPYGAIIVTAAVPRVPEPLLQQLKVGGRLVIPVGSEAGQVLQVVVKGPAGTVVHDDFHCHFVPLIGRESWTEAPW